MGRDVRTQKPGLSLLKTVGPMTLLLQDDFLFSSFSNKKSQARWDLKLD